MKYWDWPAVLCVQNNHDDVIKWKNFTCYWPFVRGIHWSPVNSPHKGQWSRALMFSLICAWMNAWVNNCEGGDFRCPLWRHCYDYCCCHYGCLKLQHNNEWLRSIWNDKHSIKITTSILPQSFPSNPVGYGSWVIEFLVHPYRLSKESHDDEISWENFPLICSLRWEAPTYILRSHQGPLLLAWIKFRPKLNSL